MPLVAILGVAIVGVVGIAGSDSPRSKNENNDSDSKEREAKQLELKKEAKLEIIKKNKDDLQNYVNDQIKIVKKNYNIEDDFENWSSEDANFQDFDQDFENIDKKIKNKVKKDIKNKYNKIIVSDIQEVKEIDRAILEINKIILTSEDDNDS